MIEQSLLLRQINPAFVQNGFAIRLAFRPTKKDEKRLSVSDGSQITPEEAWKRYTKLLGYRSVGVLGVAVGECESCLLTVQAAPVDGQPDHMEIDFSALTTGGDVDRAAKKLCRQANARGWLYVERYF